MNKIISATQIEKTFADNALQVEVLKQVDFFINPGEKVGIVGASGSGKSTLLHILGGLEKPTKGQVIIDGHDIYQVNEQKRSRLRNQYLGFVYQFHHLLPEFSVLENVCMPLLIRGTSPSEAKQHALPILEQVGLIKRQTHRLAELSGGERQRTAIARALVTKPLCVLADEPTGNLDQHTAVQVWQTMLELNKNLHTSFIVVTHDMRLAEKMDRVLSIVDGSLVEQ